jgi:hypothetical protein
VFTANDVGLILGLRLLVKLEGGIHMIQERINGVLDSNLSTKQPSYLALPCSGRQLQEAGLTVTDSIQTWALEEARRRLEAEGILKEPETVVKKD